jgi:hypothetical protein
VKATLSALVACALVAAGCGGDDEPANDKPAASAQTTQAQAQTTTAPATREAAPAAVPKQKRLEKSGYDVIVSGVEGVEPPPDGALEFDLSGGGRMTVFVYSAPADAETKAAELEKLASKYPEQAKVVVRGATTYFGTIEEPQKLDVAAFDEAVARAEGK